MWWRFPRRSSGSIPSGAGTCTSSSAIRSSSLIATIGSSRSSTSDELNGVRGGTASGVEVVLFIGNRARAASVCVALIKGRRAPTSCAITGARGPRLRARIPLLHLTSMRIITATIPPLCRRFGEIFGTESSFQCSPCMSQRSDEYRQKAVEAKNRSAQTSSPSIKSAFEEVARGWLLLAEQTE